MTARLGSEYRYFGKLVLVPFRYFSIDIYRNIDIFDNTILKYECDLQGAHTSNFSHIVIYTVLSFIYHEMKHTYSVELYLVTV